MRQILELFRIFIVEFTFQQFYNTFPVLTIAELCRFEICTIFFPHLSRIFFAPFPYNFAISTHTFFSKTPDKGGILLATDFYCNFSRILENVFPFTQDKVKVARLDLFFLCVFPAFYVGFLLAYWIHFINRSSASSQSSDFTNQ